MKRKAVQDEWVMFTLYSYRVDGMTARVKAKDLWNVMAPETGTVFKGYPDYFDCLTRLRQRGVIDLTYPRSDVILQLTPEGLDVAAAIYHERARMMA